MVRDRFTDRGAKVLELSLREALTVGDRHITPEHIRRALEREERENDGRPDTAPGWIEGGVTIKTGLVDA